MQLVRQLHPMMRNVLVPVGWVLLAMGLDLTLLPKRTDEFFSWAIRPPITAGAIGAFYVTGFLLVFMAIRGRVWARARALVPAGVVFSALALVATALHLGKFAFDSPHPVAMGIAWEWVLSYAIVPVLLLVALVPQRRLPGVDPRTERPPGWVTGSLWVAGAVLVGTAAALFLAPGTMGKVWPWALTPLTSRVLGAWSAGFGVAFLWTAWEKDGFRALPFAATLAFIGSFQLLTAIRFGDQVSWGKPAAWIYVTLLGAAAVAGGAAWARLRGTRLMASVTAPATSEP
jgi:hypothetical protein